MISINTSRKAFKMSRHSNKITFRNVCGGGGVQLREEKKTERIYLVSALHIIQIIFLDSLRIFLFFKASDTRLALLSLINSVFFH